MKEEKKQIREIYAGKLNLDDPPYSRLFIVCSKTITEEELRSAFEKYGTIEQIFLVKDTNTREPKGVAFIKFAKTSEAAQALEEMNGCCIGSHTKPLCIRIAESHEPGAKREINEEETLLRLFCVVPKTTTDQMLRDHFKQFGDLDYVSVVKDRVTNDSKGVAYVKFDKFSAAAKAFEECDKLYKVSFAKPKIQKYQLVEPFEPVSSPSSIMGYGTAFSPFSTNSSSLISSEGFRALKIIAPPSMSHNHLWRLFHSVPGLNFLKLDTKTRPGHAVAVYNNHEAAVYALKKLHGFYYPPGHRLIVKPVIDRYGSLPLPHLRGNALGRDPYASPLSARLPLDLPAVAPHNHLLKTDLADLAKTIPQATSILHSGRLAKGCAPPPGRYDPKFEDKVKGAAIQKCERFMELKSTSQSSNSTESPGNLSLTSNSSKSASFNCLPVFRTPQLPREHAKQGSSTQVKSKLKFEQLQKNGSAKEVDTEKYEALLVERDNKDATIKENEAHIEELCECIRKLEKELQDIKSEREKCKKEKEEKIEEMLLKLEVQTKDLTDLKLELEKNNSDLLKTKETCCELEKLLDEKELSLLSHKQDKEDLLLQINELKEKEIEHRSRYEMDVRELNTHYKMLEEVAAELKAVQTTKKDLEEEVMKLKESVGILSDTNSDLNCKLNQKQQLILWLQGELSSVGLELEECKSENEKMVNDFRQVKEDLIEKHNSEMEEKLNAIEDLKKLIVNEREMRLQEVQTLQENIMNSSVVRENLESSISDKEVALLTLKDKYAALEIAYEESHAQWKNADETLKSQLNELTLVYEEKFNDLKTKANKKEEEIEMKLKALGDKYCALEAEYDKACLEHKLVTEAQRLEMDDLHKKYEDDLNKARMLAHEKNQELEDMREVIDSSTKQFQNHIQNIEENLKEVKETLHNRISDYEDESSKILKDTESKVEMKIKESEMKFQQLVGEVHYTEEQLCQVTHHRDKLRISNMEHQLTIVELQDKIDTLVTELNTNWENYEADLAFVKNEHNISKRQCKKLNIGITNIQALLEALRKRLLESERDAEQMTQAFHQVKAQKAEADEQIKILAQELEAARESMARLERETVNQIEEVQKGLLNKLEEFRMKAERNVTAKEEEILEHRHKIEELSTRIFELSETLSAVEETNSEHEREIEALTEKLDHQRDCAKFATQQIAKLEASNSFYQHQIQALTDELDYQKDFSQKASDHIAAIATVKSNQEREINNLTVELNTEKGKVLKLSSEIQEIRREFDSYKEEMRIIFQNYHCDCETGIKQGDVGDGTVEKVCEHRKKIEIMNSDVKEFKRVLDSVVESRILQTKQDFQRSLAESETEVSHADHWEKKCRELEALIGPLREQLEVFKEECKALELKKEAAEEQIKELSLRYTEILGHQNHKQKIKHLIKLKDHNFELSKKVERLEEQARSQKRIIDKFKAEQRMASARKQVLQHHNPPSNSKGKENIENGPHQKSLLKAPSAKPLKSLCNVYRI